MNPCESSCCAFPSVRMSSTTREPLRGSVVLVGLAIRAIDGMSSAVVPGLLDVGRRFPRFEPPTRWCCRCPVIYNTFRRSSARTGAASEGVRRCARNVVNLGPANAAQPHSPAGCKSHPSRIRRVLDQSQRNGRLLGAQKRGLGSRPAVVARFDCRAACLA